MSSRPDYRLLVAASFLVLAVVSSAYSQEMRPLADFQKAGEMVCTWNQGNKGDAIKFIKQTNLKVSYVSKESQFLLCTWEGQLQENTLRALRANQSIKDVQPVTFSYLDDEPRQKPNADNKPKFQDADAALAVIERAGEMTCTWQTGKKKEGIEACKTLGLDVTYVSRESPFLTCKWDGKLKKETLVALLDNPTLVSVEPTTVTPLDDPKYVSITGSLVVSPSANFCKPRDPLFDKLWGMENIRAPQAWCKTQVSDAVVAVIDTGVDYTHKDLEANMWRNPGEIPGNGQDDDKDGYVDDVFGVNFADPALGAIEGNEPSPATDPKDIHYHGTHVAGTIGAVGNNGEGLTGVVWRGKVMALRVFRIYTDEKTGKKKVGAPDPLIADAIKYAVRRKAKVINLSLGGENQDDRVKEALKLAQDEGVVVVCAAGNGGDDDIGDDNEKTPHYPSSYENPNIIAVANIKRNEQLREDSNFGAIHVHIAAPGDDIWSTFPSYRTEFMGDKPTDYYTIGGTSMATPHVVGAAALLLGDPRYSSFKAPQLRQLIFDNGRPLEALKGKISTGKTLDIGFVHQGGPSGPTPPTPPTPPIVQKPTPPPYQYPVPPQRIVYVYYYPPCYNYCPQYPRRFFRRCFR